MQELDASHDREADALVQGAPPWQAVLVGLVVDFGGTFAISFVAVIGLVAYLAANGVNPDGIEQRLAALDNTHPISLALSGVGLGVSVLAGYVGARMVKRDELFWGMVQAGITTAIGILLGGGSGPIATTVLMALVGFAAVTIGAAFGAQHNQGLRARAEGEEFFSAQ